jgi:hypothetical protein
VVDRDNLPENGCPGEGEGQAAVAAAEVNDLFVFGEPREIDEQG